MLSPSPLALAAFLSLFAALGASLVERAHAPAMLIGIVSLILAGLAGVLDPMALALTLPAFGLAWLARRPATTTAQRTLLLTACGVWALAAALHLLPGFSPHLWSEGFGRSGTLPLRWHYDKGLAGLLLLLALPRQGKPDRLRFALLLPAGLALPILALLGGLADLDPRWQSGTLVWLAGNLFLTVFAEEAFFRGLIQGGLREGLASRLPFPLIVVLVAVLFALVHLPWGPAFAAMAFVAGLLYGFMAGARQALSAAIAVHFLTNAGFLLLTRSPLG
ncbi:CPBP family intramembrane glutamic endopeptidase [Uliginosibacterium paludis]|uniref:CPBP family intramembrane glutamic endopeptidase n=1 Tax=Uliginosibacterium paludis TaxID=1615952 RepID=A0ABV2CQF8_9RHOO